MLDRIVVSVCCLGLVAVLGCGGGAGDVDRYDVSGTVTFDGKPVPSGTITFLPAQGNTGPGGNANIKDGKYDTAIDGKGPTGGPHDVVITGFDGNADPGNEMPLGKPLFSEYKTKADLPKEKATQDFEVPADAKAKEPAAASDRPA